MRKTCLSAELVINRKIVEALSPTSGLYGVLWPIIVREATPGLRYDALRRVNHFLKDLCEDFRRSDHAKILYMRHHGNTEKRASLPLVLDLPTDNVEWRFWATNKADFHTVERFLEFCKIGDVDPDTGICWDAWAKQSQLARNDDMPRYIWQSTTKDIVFETMCDPRDPMRRGYCHYFGLTGRANTAIAMYRFLTQTVTDEPETDWNQAGWLREWLCE